MSQREENRSATSRSENSSNALPPKAAEAVNTPASENALDAAFRSAQTAFTSPDAFVDVHGMASSGESNLNRGSPAFNLHGSLHTVPAARSAASGIPPQSANPTVSPSTPIAFDSSGDISTPYNIISECPVHYIANGGSRSRREQCSLRATGRL